ncbi:MAG: hypothetical protein WCS86_03430 [Candidatus Paceibacterota bacterium]
MPKEKMSEPGSTKLKIEDSGNQFIMFKFFDDIVDIRKRILGANLKTLEEYTGKTREELEKVKPGVCVNYDSLIKEFKDPNLTYERFRQILDESWIVTRVV